MHPTLRHLLIPLLCLALLAACAQRAEQRRERPPLREVFAPPSIEAPAPAPAPAATSQAGGPQAGAPATAAASALAAEAASEEAAAPRDEGPVSPEDSGATSSVDTAPLEPPSAAPEAATASLKPPALDEAAPGLTEQAPADPARRDDLSLEFPTDATPEGAPPAPAEPPAASAAPSRDEAAAAAPPTEVPRIVVSRQPAVLVSIQGKPTYGPVEGTKLQRVLNTAAFLVKGISGNYYLSVYDGFMRSTKITGPWTVLLSPPRVVQEAKARALVDGEADVLAGRPDPVTGQRPTLKQAAPRVVVATQPTALVAIKGEPVYQPVEGTRLSRVVNTDARLFVHRPEDRTYLQVGDRWYRAASLKGPWEAADPAALPEGLEEAAGGPPSG